MKSLLAIALLLLLTSCGEADTSVRFDDAPEPVSARLAVPATSEATDDLLTYAASEPEKELTPAAAKAFATSLLKKIDDDEKFILDAYQLGEFNTLNKYMLVDLHNFMMKPYSKYEVDDIGSKYFPLSAVAKPYLSCDTALRDFSGYGFALLRLMKDDSADLRKIMRQQKKNFEESKAKCRHRVSLSYEDALKEFNTED